ncbi:MAG: helix-turn-helix domain-containing protein [Longimicrobiales bacterium]
MTLADRLQEAMTAAGLHQIDLVNRVPISAPHLSQILSGSKRPSGRMLRDIAAVVDARPEWLETGKGEMRAEPRPGADAIALDRVKERSLLLTRAPSPVTEALMVLLDDPLIDHAFVDAVRNLKEVWRARYRDARRWEWIVGNLITFADVVSGRVASNEAVVPSAEPASQVTQRGSHRRRRR